MSTESIAPLTAQLEQKHVQLQDLLRDMETVVVAFSGGVDSSLVLKVAAEVLGSSVLAVTAVSPTFPKLELTAVRCLSQEIGVPLVIVETNQLEIPAFVRNDATRCYHCKTDLYRRLTRLAADRGFRHVVDGTQCDDFSEERPGIQAAQALGVRSPLVEAALTKSEVRALAKKLNLSNWDKPAAACLSSRIPRGLAVTPERLRRVEEAEAFLFQEGLKHLRVRDHDGLARIEVDPADFPAFYEKSRRQRLLARFKELGFRTVTLDLEGYRPGGGNT
ncbi:MAG: ATP-dependent sacrificial sulfur transferase LarE [Nitrospirae bacterium]|nr:MAG: ATP-dependent sacrificial sulfur transferase LarE [Nitrospirota bacterium]